MGLVLNMRALELYKRRYRVNLKEISGIVGVPYSTLMRYVNGERVPDADIVCRCCNMLYVPVGYLVCPEEELPTNVKALGAEEWQPVTLKTEAMEQFRRERRWSIRKFLEEIERLSGNRFEARIYNRYRAGERPNILFALSFLNAFGLPVETVFNDTNPKPVASDDQPETVAVNRDLLDELRNDLRRAKEEQARLASENRRLKRAVERLGKGDTVQHHEDSFFVKQFVKRSERYFADLRKAFSPALERGGAAHVIASARLKKIFDKMERSLSDLRALLPPE